MPILLAAAIVASTSYADRIPEREVWRSVRWILDMKASWKGPYEGVAWYCNDGTVQPPRSYACSRRGGGIQHGVHSYTARKLAEKGIFVGTILASLKPEDLVDQDMYRTRAYIVESYLERVLAGWTLVRGKTYRGFRQTEDEEAAARTLLIELMRHADNYDHNRGLMIRLMRAMPYGQGGSIADEIRALAAELGDTDEKFSYLRFKIHAMPEPSDIRLVERYAKKAEGELSEKASLLAGKLERYYDPMTRKERLRSVRRWIHDDLTKAAIDTFTAVDPGNTREAIFKGLALMQTAERALKPADNAADGERNLLLLHVIQLVEELWIGITAQLARADMSRLDALRMTRSLLEAARITGLLTERERQSADKALAGVESGDPKTVEAGLHHTTRVIDWCRARVLADVGIALNRYEAVEPKAARVVDDILRSGVMLPIAGLLDRITSDMEEQLGGGHRLFGIEGETAGLRGINAGVAVGPLHVLSTGQSPASLLRSEVVLLRDLPPTLPPVAGILTVGAAGSLSHVSLLARNLGIPHATIPGRLADALEKSAGQDVVLGVSTGHRVAVGMLAALPEAESAQLETRVDLSAPFLEVDNARLDLETAGAIPLAEITPEDSGVRVGPKAAKLAELARLFPERVSNAVVLPFGAFVRHVDQPGKDGEPSALTQLRAAYGHARILPAEEGELLVMGQLAAFRSAIAELPFAEGFAEETRSALTALGEPGSYGLFVRSDTNVEDLKRFTGAGLNKTVPNVVDPDRVMAAIRKVWASPFTERAYRWRQKLLKNPAHVYPSVLLHKTVPSQISGVLITADLDAGDPGALTVSMSEGVAAVVDGGAPEVLVLRADGSNRLLASSRCSTRKVIPAPPAEGVVLEAAAQTDPLLNADAIAELRKLASEVQTRFPPNGEKLPWDIELGFVDGHAHLFQIRPLRTSRASTAHPLLEKLDAAAEAETTKLDLSGSLPKSPGR